jgi:hypothetical protein
MKIFRIHTDDNYWALLPVQREKFVKLKLFQLERMSDVWPELSFYVRDPARTLKGNFYDISSGGLSYDKNVFHSDLEEIFERSGEVLNATLDGSDERFYVFNPTACYNCLDRKNTQARWTPDSTIAIQVQKYAFHVDRIGDCDL